METTSHLGFYRSQIISKITSIKMTKVALMMEPIVIILIYTTISILLPAMFSCTPMSCVMQIGKSYCIVSLIFNLVVYHKTGRLIFYFTYVNLSKVQLTPN